MGFTINSSSTEKADAVQAAKKDFIKCLDNSVCPICSGLLLKGLSFYECQNNKDHCFYRDNSGKKDLVSIIAKNGKKYLFESANVADTELVSKALGYEI